MWHRAINLMNVYFDFVGRADGCRLHRNAFAIISQQSIDSDWCSCSGCCCCRATAVATAAQLTKCDYFRIGSEFARFSIDCTYV